MTLPYALRCTRAHVGLTGLALLASACGLEEVEDGGQTDEIPAAVQAAFDETCATNSSCHGSGSALVSLAPGESAAILELSSGATGEPLVVIGDVEGSYLAKKMLGTDIVGGPMPLSSQSPDDAVNIAIILGWIAGAPLDAGDESGDTGEAGDGDGDTGEVVCYADKPLPAMPSFEADVWPVLEQRCTAGCHESMTVAPHMPDAMAAYTSLVDAMSPTANAMLVVPGDPQASYLWHKLAATQTSVDGGGGLPMPATGDLCAVELQMIHAWILAGAEI